MSIVKIATIVLYDALYPSTSPILQTENHMSDVMSMKLFSERLFPYLLALRDIVISGQEFSHLERIWNLIGFFPIQFVGTSDLVFRGILTGKGRHVSR